MLPMSVLVPSAPSPKLDVLRRSQETLAYLAGILDGEGCLRITRQRLRKRPNDSPRHWPTVFVGNTSRALAEFLCRGFGGSIYLRDATSKKRAVFVWQLTTRSSVLAILTAVRPFLIVKSAQADLLIEFITDFRLPTGRGRGGGRGRYLDPVELARRERIYEQVRNLNHFVDDVTTSVRRVA